MYAHDYMLAFGCYFSHLTSLQQRVQLLLLPMLNYTKRLLCNEKSISKELTPAFAQCYISALAFLLQRLPKVGFAVGRLLSSLALR
jgi:hypothetical protein